MSRVAAELVSGLTVVLYMLASTGQVIHLLETWSLSGHDSPSGTKAARLAWELVVLLAMVAGALGVIFSFGSRDPALKVALLVPAPFCFARSMAVLLADRRLLRRSLTRFAALDAVRTYPDGIMYATVSGDVLVANDAMRDFLWGIGIAPDLTDASELWSRITLLATEGPAPNALLPSGARIAVGEKILMVSCDEVLLGRIRCNRFLALDVTQEEGANVRLEEVNATLERQGEDLRRDLAGVRQVAEGDALLRMRSHVHDTVGQRLSILHRYLEDGDMSAESFVRVRELVQSIPEALDETVRPDAATQLASLVDAFSLAGVDLEVEGFLPTDEKVAQSFVVIVREASTNAVRHGRARHVHVSLGETPDEWTLKIANAIDEPAFGGASLRHGTGMDSMTFSAEEVGGVLEWSAADKFVVSATVPRRWHA